MVFVIAEGGVNHCGRLDYAMQLIHAAKAAGADAVKFQAFDPTRLSPLNWERRALLKSLALTREELTMLAAESEYRGIEFMATPMDVDWLEFVVSLRVKRLKIGSAQVKNLEFVKAVAATGLPVIMSNGMCDAAQLDAAVAALSGAPLTLLSCVSKYPTRDQDMNLTDMRGLRAFYPGATVGLSSHCRSFWPCVAAAYAGADMLEVHLKLSEDHIGPDMESSILPHELEALVREVMGVS